MKEGKEKWFSRAKLGMFIHWGLYSLLGRGEWVMKRDGLPADEYAKLAERWNPDKNAADAWCKAARDAGMNYAVFTTVHHDGFALFDTRTDSFNSMNTPAHRDHVTEFVEACRKYGLRIGLYYSLVDWRYSEPGGDFIRMKELAYGQLRELMTNYGQIDMLWYDGSWAPDMKTPDAVVKFWEPGKTQFDGPFPPAGNPDQRPLRKKRRFLHHRGKKHHPTSGRRRTLGIVPYAGR